MQTFEIDLPSSFSPSSASEISEAVQEICAAHDLTATLIATMKSYPGSTHWHFKRGKERGVLEITHWPQKNRLWLSFRPGREGAWVAEVFQKVGEELQRRFEQREEEGNR